MRALAARAHVAYTTIARIEHGDLDPTTGMLARILRATGLELHLSAEPAATPTLAGLTDAWRRGPQGQPDTPDWTRIRNVLDLLAQHPEWVGPATVVAPKPSGSNFMDNLLAGIAETLCDEADLPRPRWTKDIPPLTSPWVTDGTPRMKVRAAAATPAQLARRGITVRADSLWRNPETVGL